MLFCAADFLQKVKESCLKIEDAFTDSWFMMLSHCKSVLYLLDCYEGAHKELAKVDHFVKGTFAFEKTARQLHTKFLALIEKIKLILLMWSI